MANKNNRKFQKNKKIVDADYKEVKRKMMLNQHLRKETM